MRVAGPLTQRDRDAIRAMRAALAVATERIEPILRQFAAAGQALTPTLVQIGKAAALVEAFDAQPRHRELPGRDDTIEWLDRHCGQVVDDPPGRPLMDADGQARGIQWWAEQRRAVVEQQITEMNRAAAQRFRVSPQDWYGTWPDDLERAGAGRRYSHTGGWAGDWRMSGG